jgi:DNA-binding transcriptional regulator GbsR (MarR family)
MAIPVSDSLSNVDDNIVNAAKLIGKSKIRQDVFSFVYFGKKQIKTVKEIAKGTDYSEKTVLTVGRKLADNNIFHQLKVEGSGTAYGKVNFCASHKNRILGYAKQPTKLSKVSTKSSPKSVTNITIKQSGVKIRVKQVTCDELDEFKAIKKVRVAVSRKIPEKQFKYGVAALAKQSGDFTDWGGERNDLYTSKIRIKGKRHAMAFAFKGPATKGKLTPGKLGKNGDQIQRLFTSAADVFFVQYHDQIDESVVEQMKRLAIANSVTEDKLVMYGIVDGDDTNRLIAAYPKQFKIKD